MSQSGDGVWSCGSASRPPVGRCFWIGEQQTFEIISEGVCFIMLGVKVVSLESECNLLLLANVIVTSLIWRELIRKFAFK